MLDYPSCPQVYQDGESGLTSGGDRHHTMENSVWDKVGPFLVPKMIREVLGRAKSPEASKTKSRKPHAVPTPMQLVFAHTHQDDGEAKEAPATFLACARTRDGQIMRIKTDEDGKGDKKGQLVCFCTNPTQKDPIRQGYFQEFVPGQERPPLPDGGHLLSSRAVFLTPADQVMDKEVFLLNISQPSINNDTPDNLRRLACRALTAIAEELNLEEMKKNSEVNYEACNEFLASAPIYEDIIKKEEKPEVEGATPTTETAAALPFDTSLEVADWKND